MICCLALNCHTDTSPNKSKCCNGHVTSIFHLWYFCSALFFNLAIEESRQNYWELSFWEVWAELKSISHWSPWRTSKAARVFESGLTAMRSLDDLQTPAPPAVLTLATRRTHLNRKAVYLWFTLPRNVVPLYKLHNNDSPRYHISQVGRKRRATFSHFQKSKTLECLPPIHQVQCLRVFMKWL